VKRPTLEEMISREQMGGLGIFLARKLMDGFLYRREDDQNVLVMYKKPKSGALAACLTRNLAKS